jgi:hypothetical protein
MSGAQEGTTAAVAAPAPAVSGPVEIFVAGQERPEEASTPAPASEGTQAASAGSEEVSTESKEETQQQERDENGRFKPRNGVQERIDEITRARRAAEREAEYWRARAQGGNPSEAQPQDKVPERPVRANFDNDEDYLEALADHKVELKLAEKEKSQQVKATQEAQASSWNSQLEAARTEITDFNEVVNSVETPVANHVAELVMESEHGAKLLYHLAKNPEVVEKLNNLSPAKTALELARIGVQFDKPASGTSNETANTASSKPAAAQISKAPPPANSSVGAGRATNPSLGDLSMDDYIATRKQQGAGWAR